MTEQNFLSICWRTGIFMFDEAFVYYQKEWNFMFAQFLSIVVVEWIEFFFPFIFFLMFTHNFYFFRFVYCYGNHFKTKNRVRSEEPNS